MTDAAQTKRVLVIAFHYPPDHSSSGVLRTLKFSLYLPHFGWEPSILTVTEKCYQHTDSALLKQIPAGVEVRRTRAINTRKTFSIAGKYLRITTIPDPYIGWFPFAVTAGLRMLRRGGIRALYSTSPVATSHLVASALKSLTGLPWVADFRDPWTEPELVRNTRAPLFRLETLLERRVLRQADRLIFTTAQLRDEMVTRHTGVNPEKAVVIPNGYDEADFRGVSSGAPDPTPIQITHTGLVDESYRSPKGFLEAVASLLRSGEIANGELQVEFLGGGDYVESPAFRSLVESLGLERTVTVHGHVGYAECLKRQSRSHILLLLQCGMDTRSLIPAKAFEYLRVGRPILALVPPSATSELFERTGGARVADPENPASIRSEVLALFLAARAGSWRSDANPTALRSYTRQELTGRLAQELDRLPSRR
jgi:glycosyltransferase involved in cell wall biosynthesis